MSAPAPRQLELLLALADSRLGLTRAELGRVIPDYAGADGGAEAARKRLERDLAALREIGVPVDAAGERIRVDDAGWRLRDPGFTPEEATVVALAASAVSPDAALDRLGARAWGKLAAEAGRPDLREAGTRVLLADGADTAGGDVAELLRARAEGRRVRFWYTPRFGADDEERHLEPWAIVSIGGRRYLVGQDVHRGGPRAFRLARVREVAVGEPALTPRPGTAGIIEVARGSLHRGGAPVRPVARIAEGTCGDVTAGAEPLGGGRWRLPEMPRGEAVELALAHAGDLLVEAPAGLRAEVIGRLRAIAGAPPGGHDADAGEEGR